MCERDHFYAFGHFRSLPNYGLFNVWQKIFQESFGTSTVKQETLWTGNFSE